MKLHPLDLASGKLRLFRFQSLFTVAVTIALSLSSHPVSAAELIETDVCVYGGTSGGIVAAVQAARLGKTAVVAEFGRHIGGLTSGGLGATDTGTIGAIGGVSREFYRRVGRQYGQGESFAFEPKVAERTFRTMLEEVNVPVYYTQRLASVTKVGARITEITMENGNVFRARMFIDATYEGDLLAMAGVSFTMGRESTNTYSESLNGIRANTPAHQFAVAVDPYIVAGDSASGLLPNIQAGNGGVPGEGDHRVQAYNFRLCLTRSETNKMPIAPPANYDPSQYELLGRYIQARVAAGHSLNLGSFMNVSTMPNGKTDINNNGAFSTDFIGMSYTYPTNTYANRALIWQQHEDYIRGFLTFLATDSRVPQAVRTDMQSWGLPLDEFQDTGGWPHALYVREARRMVSDYVMIQANCEQTRTVSDSIGLASYTMDSHNVQRIVTSSGSVTNEGDVQVRTPGPFGISYKSIVPRKSECENLFATFCLSASHIAFSSCRMEPVFMITSQSAATAAALAIDDQVAVQDVPYAKLRLQLLADKQLLVWGAGPTGSTNAIVIDNESPAGFTVNGSWTASTGAPGYIGANFLHDGSTGKGTKSARYTPSLPQAGQYAVHMRWTSHANRSPNTPVILTYAGGVTNFTVNQQVNGGTWVLVGTLPFEAGSAGNLVISNTGTASGTYVVADAVSWTPLAAPEPPVFEVVGTDTIAGEDNGNSARFTVVRTGDISVPATVGYSIGGTAAPGDDYPQPAGTLFFAPGQTIIPLTITPSPDALNEGDETITFTLLAGSGYNLGTYTNASAVIHDGGFAKWSNDHFSLAELMDVGISGPAADPDEDGISNLLEFFHDSDPKTAGAVPGLRLVQEAGQWSLAWQRAVNASSLFLRPEASTDLTTWKPASFAWHEPEVLNNAAGQLLRFPLGPAPGTEEQVFYRIAVSQSPMTLATNTARFFFSFDTLPSGTGVFTDAVTINDGFYGTPRVERQASALDSADAGGAASFIDSRGTNWLGSGSSTTPGHSLTYNPGSTGNELALTFSTIGLRNIQIRMHVRSATQGGNPPTTFSSFTYDIGGGPVAVPDVALTFPANNTFQEWMADLWALAEVENRPSVTFRWTFKDLSATPAESMRIDNIHVWAEPQ